MNKCRGTFFFLLCIAVYSHSRCAILCKRNIVNQKRSPKNRNQKSFSCSLYSQVYRRLFLRHCNQLCHCFLCVCVCGILSQHRVLTMHLYVSQWKSYCSQREMQWLKKTFSIPQYNSLVKSEANRGACHINLQNFPFRVFFSIALYEFFFQPTTQSFLCN